MCCAVTRKGRPERNFLKTKTYAFGYSYSLAFLNISEKCIYPSLTDEKGRKLKKEQYNRNKVFRVTKDLNDIFEI